MEVLIMASVNFMKCKSAGEVKAMLRHCDKEERLKHEHSNKEIDKTKTVENISYSRLGYTDICKKYDARIKFLDETTNTNKRSDRVSCFGLTIPACEGMSREESARFFFDAIKLMSSRFGKSNMISAYAHYDEIHAYIDHGEVKSSRGHLHVYVVPEIDGKLNGKQFSSKASMKSLNKAIDKLARDKYNVPFLTGVEARKRSVEELKSISNAEQEKRIMERDEIVREVIEKRNALEKSLEELGKLESKREHDEEVYMKYREEPFDYPNEIKRKKSLFGKETVELDASDYDRFMEKVSDCEETLLYSKQREGTIYEIELEAKKAIFEANQALDAAEQIKHRTEVLDKEARHYKKCLEGVKAYALNHDDSKLHDFADNALHALEQSKVAKKVIAKTVEHAFTSPSYDDDLER